MKIEIFRGNIANAPRFIADKFGLGTPSLVGSKVLDLLFSGVIWSPEQAKLTIETRGDIITVYQDGEIADWWDILRPIE